ncbi:MAG: MarR family transcriptional regulator [Thermoproteus sp.]
MLSYVLLALELAVLVFAAYTGRKRIVKALNSPNAHDEDEDVGDIDAQILKYLKSRGGFAYQGDIVRDLELPKSTVHKAVRRLAERGLVEIKRQGRINVVSLKEELAGGV